MADKPFAPLPAGTVNIDVSSSSGRVAITGTAENIRIFNDGTAWQVTSAMRLLRLLSPRVCQSAPVCVRSSASLLATRTVTR
ncbi:hypothetical protein [Sphingopyxis sp.]|uniref:hypothetical protein n=1 Tax=Sphingopyxis sp. TaxID=1908224 RepID=UPI0025F1A52C|nr:hypothetical protein [Sphingopyxis sp.]MBK6414101.1 hypothetical protein [Sphingopyxis sp.]